MVGMWYLNPTQLHIQHILIYQDFFSVRHYWTIQINDQMSKRDFLCVQPADQPQQDFPDMLFQPFESITLQTSHYSDTAMSLVVHA